MVRIRQRWSLVLLGLVLGVGFVACNKADVARGGGEAPGGGDVGLFKSDRGQRVAVQFPSASTAVIVAGQNATAAGIKAVLGGGSSLKGSAAFLEMYKKVKTSDSIWGF